MIVLDEELLGRNLETAIARWYKGTVCFVTDLRPQSVIKDDAIPKLLQQENQATFITINERDFWRKVAINHGFCVICFTLSDAKADEIPLLLRSLFRHPLFSTKNNRMGKVIRVSVQEISFYAFDDREVRTLDRVYYSLMPVFSHPCFHSTTLANEGRVRVPRLPYSHY